MPHLHRFIFWLYSYRQKVRVMDPKVEVAAAAVEEVAAEEAEEEDGAEEDAEDVLEGCNFLKVCKDTLKMMRLLRGTVLGFVIYVIRFYLVCKTK